MVLEIHEVLVLRVTLTCIQLRMEVTGQHHSKGKATTSSSKPRMLHHTVAPIHFKEAVLDNIAAPLCIGHK